MTLEKANKIEITLRGDGLYDVSTDAGYIGAVMASQLESAVKILKRDKYGNGFYNKLTEAK